MTTTAKSILLALAVLMFAACDGQSARGTAAGAQLDLLAKVQSSKSVRVGVLADNPPFSYQLGKSWVGFDIEIAQGIANNLGIEKLDFVPLSLAQRSDMVVSGGVDLVVASMTVTRYRERRVDFSIPYFQDGAALLVKAASPIRSYLDAGGRTIGAIKGSTGSFYMKQVNPDAKVELFADNAALRAALDEGKVDAIVHDYIILAGMVANAADKTAYRIAGERFTVEPYAIAVPQNQSAWRNAINHALIELWEKGEWQNSAQTWFGPGSKYASPVNFVMQVYPK
jgi:polar amino acid transport system substrate-binding protein